MKRFFPYETPQPVGLKLFRQKLERQKLRFIKEKQRKKFTSTILMNFECDGMIISCCKWKITITPSAETIWGIIKFEKINYSVVKKTRVQVQAI